MTSVKSNKRENVSQNLGSYFSYKAIYIVSFLCF